MLIFPNSSEQSSCPLDVTGTLKVTGRLSLSHGVSSPTPPPLRTRKSPVYNIHKKGKGKIGTRGVYELFCMSYFHCVLSLLSKYHVRHLKICKLILNCLHPALHRFAKWLSFSLPCSLREQGMCSNISCIMVV